MFYVVLLAMVAAFLALRLYSVLGKRTGHEQQPLPRAADDRPAAAIVTLLVVVVFVLVLRRLAPREPLEF